MTIVNLTYEPNVHKSVELAGTFTSREREFGYCHASVESAVNNDPYRNALFTKNSTDLLIYTGGFKKVRIIPQNTATEHNTEDPPTARDLNVRILGTHVHRGHDVYHVDRDFTNTLLADQVLHNRTTTNHNQIGNALELDNEVKQYYAILVQAHRAVTLVDSVLTVDIVATA